jgi:hypothetical protein
MRKSLLAAGAVLMALTMAAPAEARRSRDRDGAAESLTGRSSEPRNFWDEPSAPSRRARAARNTEDQGESTPRRARSHRVSSGDEGRHSGVGARPGKWCGWYMRTQRGGGPELNLAANWGRWGRSSGPQVGAVVVWPHHVGEITGRASNGQWIVRSGNDGGQVKERARSVSGAQFRMG